jgi:hypothetical protein
MVWLSPLVEFVCREPPIKASRRHRDARWFVLTLLLVLHWAAPQFDAPGLELSADESGLLGVSSYDRSSLPATMPRSLPRSGTVELLLPKEQRAVLPGEKACARCVPPIPCLSSGPSETIAENVSRLQLAFLLNYYSRGPPGRRV